MLLCCCVHNVGISTPVNKYGIRVCTMELLLFQASGGKKKLHPLDLSWPYVFSGWPFAISSWNLNILYLLYHTSKRANDTYLWPPGKSFWTAFVPCLVPKYRCYILPGTYDISYVYFGTEGSRKPRYPSTTSSTYVGRHVAGVRTCFRATGRPTTFSPPASAVVPHQ